MAGSARLPGAWNTGRSRRWTTRLPRVKTCGGGWGIERAMLNIKPFDARAGGNVLYKALAHPVAAEAIERLAARLSDGPLAVYDPEGVAEALWAMHPSMPAPAEVYVHDVDQIGSVRAGLAARPLTE